MTEAVSTVFGPIALTFGTGSIPVGSQSAAQQVLVVNAINHTITTHPIEGYFNGINVACGGVAGTIKVRAYSANPVDADTYQIYEATFEFAAINTTLSDSLGSELVVFQAGCFITLEGSVPNMEAVVRPYLMSGHTACRV